MRRPWCFGPGILAAGLMERCGVCPRLRTRSSSPQLVFGSRPVRHVRAKNRRQAMTTYQLNVNGQRKEVNVDPSTPLLWVLREELKMTGTKYGCGISACGACTVHVAGIATRSCVVPVSLIGDRPIVTIERVGEDPVRRAIPGRLGAG